MSVKHYGIFVAHAPGVKLHTEGLGRLLAAFLRAASQRKDLHITIACPSWSKADLMNLAKQEGFDEKAFTLVMPSRVPFALSVLLLYRRLTGMKYPRPRRLVRLIKWTRERIAGFFLTVADQMVTTRSWITFALWMIFAFVTAIILSGPVVFFGLIWATYRIIVIACVKFLRHRPSRRIYLRLMRAGSSPALKFLMVDLYQKMMRREILAMVALADRQTTVRAWFSPTAFLPEIIQCRAAHLICLPDVVFSEAAVGFARMSMGNRFSASLINIETSLRLGKSFTTYSSHVAHDVLVGRYGVPLRRISVIPHAPVRLDRWISTRGFPDNALATRTYCRGLLRAALSKATYRRYAAQFANTDVRFLFYASQFRPSKNVVGLLRVYERLLRHHYIGHKLILTGDPQIMPEIEQFITEHRLEHDVLCLRGLSAPELAACYKLADLAVNPTFSEGGCPFTLTEALSVGTPVVMSNIPVAAEIITDPDLQKMMLFDPRDLTAMEERILWALAHRDALLSAQLPLYNELAMRTWDDVVSEHVLALEQAVVDQAR